MSYSWMWVTVPVASLCLVLLGTTLSRLIRIHRGSVLVSVPLIEEQDVTIDGVGRMLLHGEGPRGTDRFARLDFRLTDLSRGRDLGLDRVWLKASSSGRSTARLSLRSFRVEQPGSYRLRLIDRSSSCVSEKPPHDSHRIVISHDVRGRTAGAIVGVVLSGIGAMAGLGGSLVVYLVNR